MFLYKGKQYATAGQVAVAAGAKDKPRMKVQQGTNAASFAYHFGNGWFDYASFSGYDNRTHGGVIGKIDYYRSIGCDYLADKLEAVATYS